MWALESIPIFANIRYIVSYLLLAFVTECTFALVFPYQIQTRGVVLTLVVFAFVDVNGAIVCGESHRTAAFVRHIRTDAPSVVKAIRTVT